MWCKLVSQITNVTTTTVFLNLITFQYANLSQGILPNPFLVSASYKVSVGTDYVTKIKRLAFDTVPFMKRSIHE